MERDSRQKIRLWCLTIAIILIPLNTYWLVNTEMRLPSCRITNAVPFATVVFILAVFVLVNFLLKQLLPARYTSSQGELLTIYTMLSLSTGIASIDMLGRLPHRLVGAFWFATPENDWQSILWPYIPKWLTIQDKIALRNYFEGHSSIFDLVNLKAWLIPVIWWVLFSIAYFIIMLGINTIFRKQWTEVEKLSYPVIELPVQMTSPRSNLFKNKAMWTAFAIVGGINILNGISFLYPSVPSLHVKAAHRTFFTEKPWNAIGTTVISFYPFLIGLGFLMPLDLSFSCWFFYWLGRFQLVISSAIGWQQIHRFPYFEEQSCGALIGLVALALWGARSHLKRVVVNVFTASRMGGRDEVRSHRTVFMWILASFLFLLLFCIRAGMPVRIIVVYFVLYYILSTAITRIRAESGFPMFGIGWFGTIPNGVFGTRTMGAKSISILSILEDTYSGWFLPHIMPFQLEGFKMAERTGLKSSKMRSAMAIAIIVGSISVFCASLYMYYDRGASSPEFGWLTNHFAYTKFARLETALASPTDQNLGHIIPIGMGFLGACFLMIMRMRFVWWPFHPLGYALQSDWVTQQFWLPVLISSVIKWGILKFGGLKAYRKAIPIFLGFILGDLIVGSVWYIIALVIGKPMYVYFY